LNFQRLHFANIDNKDEYYVSNFIKKVKQEISYFRALMVHPKTPKLSRWLIGGAIAYLLSPVDLIPDWIPVLGHLDDLLIVPLLIWAALVIIPSSVKKECRDKLTDNRVDATV
jgi:uncharacterized membrane protein YkvA (DUF1232 family)